MTLSPGHRIGNYEILGPAGAGGMGEVYRARDTRLDRTVAIKALPAGFAADPTRLGRFEREAKVLASLNHPNIASIHGIEDATGGDDRGPYLVLEFVDGLTLAQKLAQGTIPISDTIRVCAQIAEGIEAAHEKGVVHRDLKPSNVMLAPGNRAKVLDFGLAKDTAANPNLDTGMSASPTMANPATEEGMVLGTAPYMSPEQARGAAADQRVDVWAFGCILMECLTGRQVFAGDTPSDVIARILEREPEWDRLPPATPPRLLDILRRCLTKDVNLRPRNIGDLGRELKAILSDSSASRAVEAAQDVPSLAVLYFENLANDPDSEYFCAGITEDILTDLSKIQGLRVASKNAVSRYRGKTFDLSRIAMDLGVKAVLEGSVRRAGDRIRITTQLINAADGFQLWGERFDRTLDDVFAVQDEIAKAIVDALRVAMTPSEVEEIVRDRPDDAKAYDLFLKGREKYGQYNRESMEEALGFFRSAVEVDPDYSLAWAGIADCHGQFLQYRWAEDREATIQEGLESARRAIALNPKLPDGHKAQANVLSAIPGEEQAAMASLAQAIRVDPNYTPAMINLGVGSFMAGQVARAERLMRRAIEVDPQQTFAMVWLGALLFFTQRYEEVFTWTRRLRELSDAHFYRTASYVLEVPIYLELGEVDKAKAAIEEALADERIQSESLLPPQALLADRLGHTEEARKLLLSTDMRIDYMLFDVLLTALGLRLGEHEFVTRAFSESQVEIRLTAISARLMHTGHTLLDLEPLAPRQMDLTLVWPLQAKMIDEARFRLFRKVEIESGRPEGTDILGEF